MNIAGTNLIQSPYTPHHDPTCPSCDQCVETCAYVISCKKTGRVDELYQYISLLVKCLKKVSTHTKLRTYILQYARGRGGISMKDVIHGTLRRYSKLSASQDLFGWISFLGGMISNEILVIQQDYLDLRGARDTPTTPKSLAKGLIVSSDRNYTQSVAVSKCACAWHHKMVACNAQKGRGTKVNRELNSAWGWRTGGGW